MRVITGSIKGRKLKTVRDRALRPTAGKVKEAFFDILQREIPGSVFLDLYAGAGGVGIEALSRGSDHVTFVESNRAVLNALRQNLKISGFSSKANIFGTTAERFLRSLTIAAHAPSLGGVETLVSEPRLTSHASLTPAERAQAGIPDGFLRCSLGLEDADDLIADFAQALAQL